MRSFGTDSSSRPCILFRRRLDRRDRAGTGAGALPVRSLSPDEISTAEIAAKKERDLRRLLDLLKLIQSGDLRRYVLDYFELD